MTIAEQTSWWRVARSRFAERNMGYIPISRQNSVKHVYQDFKWSQIVPAISSNLSMLN
jgi:hypothetical protein